MDSVRKDNIRSDVDDAQQSVNAEVTRLLAIEPKVQWPHKPLGVYPRLKDIVLMHGLVVLGMLATTMFVVWFFDAKHIGSPWMYGILTTVLLYKLALMLYEWICYLGIRPWTSRRSQRDYSIDVLTTWCPGEPKEMVVATLKSIQRIRLPHTTYLCDEGDDLVLRRVCERLGVRHVTRSEKIGAKAGNINNALRQATGEIVVIMDPDHEASPYFLERILAYFDDPKIGFVQSVQGYYNQNQSLIAQGAAEQTYHFYGPIMMGMSRYGITQAIGANCVFRRSALDSIAGHATGLAEDMHTTLKLYAKGWKSKYIPEVLTRGLTPNTFAAYAKQQLKWACGTWDILIETYWRVFGSISWANRFHFLYVGLFYLRGLVVLLGASIPIVALVSGLTPWKIEMIEFVRWYAPVLIAHLLVRQVAQRWVMGSREWGFYLTGGFLMTATWWIHLRGVISSIFRVKIPYIPTPKNDEASDAWGISMPNLSMAIVSMAAVVYGLWWDWSPFAWLMALFALINAIALGYISIIAQQSTMHAMSEWLQHKSLSISAICSWLRNVWSAITNRILWLLRRQTVALLIFIAGGSIALSVELTPSTMTEQLWSKMENRTHKKHGDFLLGVYRPEADTAYSPGGEITTAMVSINDFEAAIDKKVSIVSLYQPWGPQALSDFPKEQFDAIRERGAIPMLTWEPLTHRFPRPETGILDNASARIHWEWENNIKVFAKIVAGDFDEFLKEYAIRIRDYGGPVFIRFAHEPDNPGFAWSTAGYNTAEEFIAGWRYVVEYFDGMGATNVAWVWSPWKDEAIDKYYPGNQHVDWVGLTILNYGSYQGQGSWDSFDELYEPFRKKLRDKHHPIMLSEFGSTGFGGDRAQWTAQAIQSIGERPEIGGVVFFDSIEDKNWPIEWQIEDTHRPLSWRVENKVEMQDIALALDALADKKPMSLSSTKQSTNKAASAQKSIQSIIGDNRRISGSSGNWQFEVDGRPFYIKGVAYDAGHGWRSTSKPTRLTVERDLEAIAQMGANSIRRYAAGWADRNILHAAEKNNLKVMMGFWLEQDIDYRKDVEALKTIERRVVNTVKKWRDHPAVISWTVGNETWGLLKHHYSQPVLTDIRFAYLQFIERLAQRIKELDKVHPVFTSVEHSSKLPGLLAKLPHIAPSIDAVGINVYYDSHLDKVDNQVSYFAAGMPWLLSEFGPDGYWDTHETRWDTDGFPLEISDTEKASLYVERWQNNVIANAPRNIGGVAFAWGSRLEGTINWFGLVDADGRRKPAYYALRSLWRGEKPIATTLPKNLTISLQKSQTDGTEYFSAKLNVDHWPQSCTIEWRLVEEGDFKIILKEQTDCDVSEITMATPSPGRYRLHVSVVADGNVISVNQPLVN